MAEKAAKETKTTKKKTAAKKATTTKKKAAESTATKAKAESTESKAEAKKAVSKPKASAKQSKKTASAPEAETKTAPAKENVTSKASENAQAEATANKASETKAADATKQQSSTKKTVHVNNGRNKQRKGRNARKHRDREVVPSVSKEELEALKVTELRARAKEYDVDTTGLKKADLVDVLYAAALAAEGFIEYTGILDILQDGYGFLRMSDYLPSEKDCYVPTSVIRKNGLRRGDKVTGMTRPARSNEKYPSLQKIYSVNGLEDETWKTRPRFGSLTPVYPDEPLVLEHGKNTVTARAIDLVCPIGKGQRGLIVSPPKAGKTTILKNIAAAISANNPEVHLMCLLVDERPEEVTDMQRSIHGEVIASTFDMPTESHIQVSELVIERAKRLVEQGGDVVILLDSLTRLARAYNLSQPASGRVLSGGVDSTALYPPKKFLGAARNIEGGGSLTILASALVETGSKMDEVIFEEFKGTGNMEVKLDRALADRRIFPAIDTVASGTRKEDLLLDAQEAPLIWAVRRILTNMNNTERATDMLIKSLKRTNNNQEFLMRMAKKAQHSNINGNTATEL